MDYSVRRLDPETGHPPYYQLFDANGELLLVADRRMATESEEEDQLRLTRPDGRLMATVDLPEITMADDEAEDPFVADYAVVQDYAVYAILNVQGREELNDGDIYFMMEVEGEKWLVLPHPEEENCYAFYDQVPAGLRTYDRLTEVDLPPCIGRLCRTEGEHAFSAELSPERLQQTGLVVLALAYFIDKRLQLIAGT